MSAALSVAAARVVTANPSKLDVWLALLLADLLRRPGADPDDIAALSALVHCIAWPTEVEVCGIHVQDKPIILIHRFLLTPAYRPMWPALSRILVVVETLAQRTVRKLGDIDTHLGTGVRLLKFERAMAMAYGKKHVREALDAIAKAPNFGTRSDAFKRGFTLLMGPPQAYINMEVADVFEHLNVSL